MSLCSYSTSTSWIKIISTATNVQYQENVISKISPIKDKGSRDSQILYKMQPTAEGQSDIYLQQPKYQHILCDSFDTQDNNIILS